VRGESQRPYAANFFARAAVKAAAAGGARIFGQGPYSRGQSMPLPRWISRSVSCREATKPGNKRFRKGTLVISALLQEAIWIRKLSVRI
jgi:hypothetical protein